VTKTALECYADSLRLELQLLGVRVIAVRPGAFRTSLVDESGRELSRLTENTQLYAGRLGRIRRIMDAQTASAGDPKRLAEVYLRIVMTARPRLRYSVNASLGLKAYSALPRGLQALIMRRLLKEKRD
jgi:NAD(P)-dependent dehydrogenase (short-subunit alcohol dehydrogenase family)